MVEGVGFGPPGKLRMSIPIFSSDGFGGTSTAFGVASEALGEVVTLGGFEEFVLAGAGVEEATD